MIEAFDNTGEAVKKLEPVVRLIECVGPLRFVAKHAENAQQRLPAPKAPSASSTKRRSTLRSSESSTGAFRTLSALKLKRISRDALATGLRLDQRGLRNSFRRTLANCSIFGDVFRDARGLKNSSGLLQHGLMCGQLAADGGFQCSS